MAAEPGKSLHSLSYSTLPNPRRPVSLGNVIFLAGIWLIYGPVLIVLLFFTFITVSNVVSGAPTFGFSTIGSDWVNLIVLPGVLLLLTLIFRWAHRKVRNREVDH
ncbi:MAG TPA: hypothetical protein VGP99_01080 [Tepidisphaeraceae bacterium]|jgi:hypothetical protein|nr:hypothetical protein [Tepidisphaeraceae bacterium]